MISCLTLVIPCEDWLYLALHLFVFVLFPSLLILVDHTLQRPTSMGGMKVGISLVFLSVHLTKIELWSILRIIELITLIEIVRYLLPSDLLFILKPSSWARQRHFNCILFILMRRRSTLLELAHYPICRRKHLICRPILGTSVHQECRSRLIHHLVTVLAIIKQISPQTQSVIWTVYINESVSIVIFDT